MLPKWLAQPDIVSLDLGDLQMPIEDMKELDESILQILKSTGAKYFFPVQRQVKHKEAFSTLVESLVQMTCIDFTNFLEFFEIGRVYNITVSYTHLTLPTILRV